jgi:hypothetical protein
MIRKLLPWWVWGVLAGGFAIVTIGISIGFAVLYIHGVVSNECGALTYLLQDHHLHQGVFRNTIQVWANRDGC